MAFFSFETLLNLHPMARWGFIVLAFLIIGVLDFSTPSEFVWAYLYTIPLLVSVSFLQPKISLILMAVAVVATILNLFFPVMVASVPSVLTNRGLAALSILISSFLMVRYIQYQQRIQEQDKLLETERRLAQVREDLMATLSHDLKTPLLGTEKALDSMLTGGFGDLLPAQRQLVETLHRANRRQLDLVESLLSSYRYDAMGVELALGFLDLDELVADILTEVQPIAADRQIQLDYVCRRTPPKIRGDGLQMKRVVANLLHNALNYSPAHTTVTVTLREVPSALRLDIQDQGPGLSDEQREQVFQRFYRTDHGRNIVGTGLGLYLSRQIVQAHRGDIGVESTPGKGCCFYVSIPLVKGSQPSQHKELADSD